MDLKDLGLESVFTFREKDSEDTKIFYDITKTAQKIFGDIVVRAGIEFSYVTLELIQRDGNERYIQYLKDHYSSVSKDMVTPSSRLEFDSDTVVLFFNNNRIVIIDASEWGWIERAREEDKQFQW